MTDISEYIKIQDFHSSKHIIRRVKTLARYSYPEYRKNSYRSIKKIKLSLKMDKDRYQIIVLYI